MGASLILWFLQEATPAPKPPPDINKIISIISVIVKSIGGIAANPYGFLIGLGVSLAALLGVYLFIKKKLGDWAVAAAKKDTDIGWQNQVDTRIPENEKNNEKDNKDRTDLDKIH